MKKFLLIPLTLFLCSGCNEPSVNSSSLIPSSEIEISSEPVVSSIDDKGEVLTIHYLNLLKDPDPAPLSGSLNGDCIYIQYGDIDILIDAGGSTGVGRNTILPYLKDHVLDNKIEFVITSHADMDHIIGLAGDIRTPYTTMEEKYADGILTNFEIGTIISYNYTHTSQASKNYMELVEYKQTLGTNYCTVNQNWDNNDDTSDCRRNYHFDDHFSFSVLYTENSYNGTGADNNRSVCTLFKLGDLKFLFTGDAESSAEKSLVSNNDVADIDVFKAGHHGSASSNTDPLLEVIKPKTVVIPCSNYSHTSDWNFPTPLALQRIFAYTDDVYATFLNGNVIIEAFDNHYTVNGSLNNTQIKDSEWYITTRL